MSSEEDIDLQVTGDHMADEAKDEAEKPKTPKAAPATGKGKERGKAAGRFNILFQRDKKITSPPAPQHQPKDPKLPTMDAKGPSVKEVAKDFKSGVVLQSPVGMALVFTTMLSNFGFLASTLNEAKSSSQKPETVTFTPSLELSMTSQLSLSGAASAWRMEVSLGFGVSPAYEGACYSECETLKNTIYSTNVNAALILRSIGTFTDRYGDRYHSFGAAFKF